jgi:hypothetical protein
MIHHRCPHCLKFIAVPEDVGGTSRLCPRCDGWFVVPFDVSVIEDVLPVKETAAAPPPSPRSRAARSKKARAQTIGILTVVLGSFAAFWVVRWVLYLYYWPPISIYADNQDAEEATVAIDGGPPVHVAPGQYQIVKCWSGQRRIQVTRGEKVVFDEVKELMWPHGRLGEQYLLNVGGKGHYLTYEVKYQDRSDQMLAELLGVRPVRRGKTREEVKAIYQEATKRIKLLGPIAWIEIGDCDFVLEPPAATARGYGGETYRKLLTRVRNPKDCDALKQALAEQDPTEEDLANLGALLSRLDPKPQ